MQTFEETPHNLKILTEQLRIAYRQLPVAVGTGLFIGIPTVWVFHQFVSLPVLLIWYGSLFLASIFRLFSIRHITADNFKIQKAHRYAVRYRLSAFLTGSVWASLVLLIPFLDTEYHIVIMVLLLSVAGGALTSNSSLITAYYAYTLPLFSALTIQSFLMGTTQWYFISALALAYAIFMMVTAWKLSRSMFDSIAQHFLWQETALELEKAHTELNIELKERQKAEAGLKETQVELENAVRYLKHISAIDELTGIANRRSFDAALAREWSRARRDDRNIALLMIDVDYFKEFNDIYGHPAGDGALKSIALVLRKFSKRAGDLSARYGGEEFALILANASQEYIEDLCEVLLGEVSKLKIKHDGSDVSDYLSISIGAAIEDSPASDDYSPIIATADARLYEAKQSGRNQFKFDQ